MKLRTYTQDHNAQVRCNSVFASSKLHEFTGQTSVQNLGLVHGSRLCGSFDHEYYPSIAKCTARSRLHMTPKFQSEQR